MANLKTRVGQLEGQADPRGERYLSPMRQTILAKLRAAVADGRLTVDQIGKHTPNLARMYFEWLG